MGELGAESERGHRRVGEVAGELAIDYVISVGSEAQFISESAKQSGAGQVSHMGTTEEATSMLRELARPGDLVLVKGSRSAKMEKIVEGLATV
jgi:UDP-N-acetylmuramoyl-tripeptide--D-alanyl-D-alanine ligase